ncbi:hypothetical protein QTJ16_004624 [Diplocarpon rosae]|uniref:STEEP1 domain-containing protein n=1 Tax=Diplocarpon rosae TaxID=946125 RepID=A0AAD9T0F0_9HELO|nr:hypothetical protein QTJ16_004624 [Diplocarpon rosae]
MPLTPEIHTYHCICTSLLFSTTHTLSSLPQHSAIILPIPSSPPSPSLDALLPAEGYTVLLGLTASPASSSQPTIIRREDGFEKRILYRCSRCGVVVGYELQGATANIDAGGADVEMGGTEKGKERGDQEEVYAGKIIYILPAGIMSSRFLAETGRSGKKLAEEDVAIRRGGVGVFE